MLIKMSFQPPRGMSDIGPEEMAIRQWMYGKIQGVFSKYGYAMVEPTFIESFDVLAAKSGEDVKEEIYYFKDKGGRKLGLRFDITVGLARMVATNQWPKPIRLSALSSMWRYDRPGYGRERWFYQWDVEVFGCKGSEADAEVIALSIDVLESMGLKDFVVKIGNRRIAESLIRSAGVRNQKNVEGALRTVDKIAKLSETELFKEFGKYKINKAVAKEILENVKGGLKGLKAKDESMVEGIKETKEVMKYLKAMGKGKRCEVDLSVVRGLGYYTGLVWEAMETKGSGVGSLFAGGRYDSLVGLYGDDLPATGCAGGIERTIIALKDQDAVPKEVSAKPEVLVIPVGDTKAKVMEVAEALRKAGKKTVTDVIGRGLSKNLQYANKIGIPNVVIVGERDLAKGKVTLRNMESGKEKQVAVSGIGKAIK